MKLPFLSSTYPHKFAVLATGVFILLIFLLGANNTKGWLTYILQLPALGVIIITALARVNDIGPKRTAWVWQVRRVGLSFVGAAAGVFLVLPWAAGEYPTWQALLLSWGMALTWLSTPGQPPWEKYVFGKSHYVE